MASKKAKSGKRRSPATAKERAEVMARICKRLRAGGCSIRQACKAEGIGVQTVQDWAAADETLSGQYVRAREEGLALDADDIHELAATKPKDAVEAASIRLQVDTLKWDLCKRLPKIYGERRKVEHEGKLTLAQLIDQSYEIEGE